MKKVKGWPIPKQNLENEIGVHREPDNGDQAAPVVKSKPQSFLAVQIHGPYEVSHGGHLRATGKECGHLVQFAWLYQIGKQYWLGLSFTGKRTYRCYYPSTESTQPPDDNTWLKQAINGGSYWFIDELKDKDKNYIPF